MEPVLVSVTKLGTSTELRRQTWELLKDLRANHHLRLIDAAEEHGHRIEVTSAPPLQSLREWLVEHPANRGIVELLIRQLTPVLSSLHSRGVAHLNVRPELIYVTPGPKDPTSDLQFTLGGLEDAIPVAQDELISIGVDPLYAPPEAAGLYRHQPGPSLFAWDWWSLGRVTQEYVLGRHIIGYHLNRDVARVTAELRLRAEAMLFEKEPSGVRAGAVELMNNLDPAVDRLLRGLLTASRDGRWKQTELESWCQGREVRDRYNLPRNAHLFTWRGQAYSIAEAADYFAQEANWEEGEANLFSPPQDKTTLLAFIRGESAQASLAERLEALLAKSDLPAWKDLPLGARQTALAAAAWCVCADAGAPAALRLRGRRLDWIGLQALLNGDNAVELTPLLHALTAKPYIELVETLDAEAARSLTLLAQSAREAIEHGIQEGWILPTDSATHAELFRLAVQPPREIDSRLHALHSQFATTRTPVLGGYFASPKPERWKMLLLAYTGARAAQFLYVSHQERNLERFSELSQQGGRLAAFVFWLGLRRVLTATPWLFLPWWIVTPAWLALAAVVYLRTHDALPAGIALAGLFALRTLAHAHIRRMVRRCDPDARPWSWGDHTARCRAEAERMRPSDAGTLELPALIRRLEDLVREMSELPIDPRPGPLPTPPRFTGLWGSAGAALLAVIIGAIQFIQTLDTADALTGAPDRAAPASPSSAPASAAGQPAFVTPPPGAAPGLYEEINVGFGRRIRGPLRPWDVPPDRVGRPVTVRRREPASADQRAQAMIDGERVLRPYPSKGIDAVIAVRVPAESRQDVGLMLFDAKMRSLVDQDVHVVDGLPDEGVWTRLGSRTVVYLSPPPPPPPQPTPPAATETVPLPELPPN
ncbi:MAG: serine/threonine-protein kinase [Opitutaceae bacterium]